MRIVIALVLFSILGCTRPPKEIEISTSQDEAILLLDQFRRTSSEERENLAERLADIEFTDAASRRFVEKCGDSLELELLSDDLTGKYWLIVFTGNLKSSGVRYLKTLDELKLRNTNEISSKSFKAAIEPAESKIRSAK